ncbi:MAG: hypothetical protein V7K38_17445 [Nostoc sp.]
MNRNLTIAYLQLNNKAIAYSLSLEGQSCKSDRLIFVVEIT